MKPIKFEIEKLFGRKGNVELILSEKVQIIYGINGSGKTTALKILNGILTGRLYEIRSINFQSATVLFDNGKSIKLIRTINRDQKQRQSAEPRTTLSIKLFDKSNKEVHTNILKDDVELSEKLPIHIIESEINELTRIGRREWQDSMTGDILTLTDIVEKYGNRLPWLKPSTEIEWYRDITKLQSVKFIQTQRLMIAKFEGRPYEQSKGVRYQNAVIAYSEKLLDLIRTKLSDSMRFAQTLDSSYPLRLLNTKAAHILGDDRLQDLLTSTKGLGEKLKKSGLLVNDESVDIRLKSITKEDKKAIGLYLEDSLKKFQFLEELAAKIELFLEIVNDKFQPRKSVVIAWNEGIKIILENGESIHPKFLSSGEQHEIVLLFDLIFFSDPGTLVLIDEPEISLHIDWQKRFLSDVESIGNASDLRFILATHSPAIIGNRVDVCQEI